MALTFQSVNNTYFKAFANNKFLQLCLVKYDEFAILFLFKEKDPVLIQGFIEGRSNYILA